MKSVFVQYSHPFTSFYLGGKKKLLLQTLAVSSLSINFEFGRFSMKRREKASLVACNNQKAVFQTRYLILQVLREIALAMEMILVMEKANTMKSPVRTISQQRVVSISGCWFKTKIFLLNTQHQSDMPAFV